MALTTLTRTSQTTAASDSSALQRHRAIILECLHDPDISIRRRALDLCFHLMNSSTIRILTREILSFLELCDGETKTAVATRMCEYAGRYRPSKRWEIDTVIRILRVTGAWVEQYVVNYLVKLVTNCPVELQQHAVKKLYGHVSKEGEKSLIQEGLLESLFWTIGEYGDLLIIQSAGTMAPDEDAAGEVDMTPNEQEVVALIEQVLNGPYATSLVKEYAITALAKLSSRFTESFVVE